MPTEGCLAIMKEEVYSNSIKMLRKMTYVLGVNEIFLQHFDILKYKGEK